MEQAYLSRLVRAPTQVELQIEHWTIDSLSEERAICKTTLSEGCAILPSPRSSICTCFPDAKFRGIRISDVREGTM